MTPERLENAIQTVKINIDILESEKNRVGNCVGVSMQLEFEMHVLYLLEAEQEGRMHIDPVPDMCLACRTFGNTNIECNNAKCFKAQGGFKNGKEKKNFKSKKRLFCLGRRNK